MKKMSNFNSSATEICFQIYYKKGAYTRAVEPEPDVWVPAPQIVCGECE